MRMKPTLDDQIRANFGYLGAITGILRTTYMGRPSVEFTVERDGSRETYSIEVEEQNKPKGKTP